MNIIAQYVSMMNTFNFLLIPLYSWEPNICLDIKGENGNLIGSMFLFHSIKDNCHQTEISIYLMLYHSVREGLLHLNCGDISISTM